MRTRLFLASLALWLIAACAGVRTPGEKTRDHVTLDLLRSAPGAEKLYIQAGLPNGEKGIFLVDTGAGISAISTALAERLGIPGRKSNSTLSGLGGQAALVEGLLPSLSLGGLEVRDIEVAIGVPGLPSHAGWMPIDGILGNNVWAHLVMVIDYQADVLELGRPGTIRVPGTAVPMAFDGQHVLVPVTLHAGNDGEVQVSRSLHLELDTGARRILLSGSTGEGFEALASEGQESIFGIGASEDVPLSAFYRETRRIPIVSVELGGAVVESPGSATWLNYKDQQRIGPPRLAGLLGHAVLSNHRVIIDFPGQQFALLSSNRRARQLDGHQVLLEQDLKRYGEDPDRGLFRARMHLAQSHYDDALDDLSAYLNVHSQDAEALITLTLLLRNGGRFHQALANTAGVGAGDLVDHGEILASVNSLVLAEQLDAASRLAKAAQEARPNEAIVHVVLADVAMATGQTEAAGAALMRAAQLRENPDAFLHRRAQLALAEGDAYAAVAHLRRRLDLYPTDGYALWSYALLSAALPELASTFLTDLERSQSRLHYESLPLDFITAALVLHGDLEGARAAKEEGIARDCLPVESKISKANCEAWYRGMAQEELDDALAYIEGALEQDPHRPDFLDTLAVVQVGLGDYKAAREASWQAARYSPEMLYHLWQFRRLDSLATTQAP